MRFVNTMSRTLIEVVGTTNGLPGLYWLPPMHGLGICPMVRPHCSSSSVRLHSKRVPVKNPASSRLSVRSRTAVKFA